MDNQDKPEPNFDKLPVNGQGSFTRKGERMTGWEDDFIRALTDTGIVRVAAEMTGINPNTAYRLKATDKAFAARFEEALQQATQLLIAEAIRRGRDGVERRKTIYYQGAKVGEEVHREYSDNLLMFLIKALDPRFRDSVDHNYNLRMIREEAQRIAEQEGLDVGELIAEAERLTAGKGQ